MQVFEQAEPGTDFLITRYRGGNSNLRTQLLRIIKKAGLKPWPKLFQSLRSTRQTELSEIYPAHVVCAWLGNSEDVAKGHYLQVTDSHFTRAAQLDPELPDSSAEKASQNAAQQPAVPARRGSQTILQKPENPEISGEIRSNATPCKALQNSAMALVGLEPTRFMGDGF